MEEKKDLGVASTEENALDEEMNCDCFICPISFEVMTDPVITPDGITYEREAIERCLTEHTTDLSISTALSKEQLIPNRSLKDAIELWQQLDKEWRSRVKTLQEDLKKAHKKTPSAQVDKTIRFLHKRALINRRKLNRPSFTHALELLKLIPERFTGEVRDKIILGLLALSHEEGEEAEKIFSSLINAYPKKDDWLYMQWGIAYHVIGKQHFVAEGKLFLLAIEKFKLAFEINPKNDEAQRRWGWALDRLSRCQRHKEKALLQEALTHYDMALTINPKNEAAYGNKGMALFSLKQYKPAIKVFENLLAINETSSRALITLGELYKMLRDQEAAFKYFQLAVHHHPENEIAHYKLGKFHEHYAKHVVGKSDHRSRDRHFDEACIAFEKAMELNPRYEEPYTSYANCLTRLSSKYDSKAREYYEKALASNPKDRGARQGLKWLDQQNKQAPSRSSNRRYTDNHFFAPRQRRQPRESYRNDHTSHYEKKS